MEATYDCWPELLASGHDGAALSELIAGCRLVAQSDRSESPEPEAGGARDVDDRSAPSSDGHAVNSLGADPHTEQQATWVMFHGDGDRSAGVVERRERQRLLSAKRKRAHRERVKLELEALSAQVAELERELRVLQSAQASNGPVSDQQKRVMAWRELAARHQERRRAAERLNEQLQRKIARNGALLGDLACVPTGFGLADNQSVATQYQSSHVECADLFDDSLLIGFALELDAIYARTDEAMLRGGRFPSEPEDQWSHSVARRCDRSTCGELFEVVDSFVLPFAYAKTSPALWRSMAQVYSTDTRLMETAAVKHPDQTIAVHYRIYDHQRDGSCMRVSFVIRQYVERDRTVLVWRALSEGQEGSMAGVATDETGWSVLRPVLSGSCFSFGDQGGTVMNTFVRMIPLVSDVAKRRGTRHDLESFVSKVISSVSEDGDAISRLMDGLLLTDALA